MTEDDKKEYEFEQRALKLAEELCDFLQGEVNLNSSDMNVNEKANLHFKSSVYFFMRMVISFSFVFKKSPTEFFNIVKDETMLKGFEMYEKHSKDDSFINEIKKFKEKIEKMREDLAK